MKTQPCPSRKSYSITAKAIRYFSLFICLEMMACATALPKQVSILNSERIEQKFGSYGVRILDSSTSTTRRSSLYSFLDSRQICRTFAETQFHEPLHPLLQEEHRLITQEGKSIGAVFKERGWEIEKKTVSIKNISPSYEILALMNISAQPLVEHQYDFIVKKGNTAIKYARIREVHHPDYLTMADF